MKIGIIYTSLTGNNSDLAHKIENKIKQQYEQATCKHILIQQETNKGAKNIKYEQFDAYVFGSWTDCFVCPPFVVDYITNFPQQMLNGKYAFTFNAHGGDGGNVQIQLNNLLQNKGALVTGHISIKYCNNYYKLTYPKTQDQLQSIEEKQFTKVDEQVKLFLDVLKKKVPFQKQNINLSSKSLSFFTQKLASCIAKNCMRIAKYFKVTDKCVGCSQCVNNCPEGVLKIVGGKAKFVNVDQCIGCFGCFQICPQKAVLHIKGKMDNVPQYKFQKIQIGDGNKFHSIDDLQERYNTQRKNE